MRLRRGEINLHVRDLEAEVRFYKDALGFAPEEDPDAGPPEGRWAKLRAGDVVITLFRSPAGPGGPPGMTADLLVDDFEGALARLRAAGASLDPVREMAGTRFLEFRDPEGIAWELIEDPPPPPVPPPIRR